ncbi:MULTISPECIES: hypothetical protein [unclassified Sphingobium]|uniref:hypothetical protein n=1 Tax=unclassified Sphingobium TaxID=2611147 RepID=UPI0007F38EFF|nr:MULTISPECIES: hypothetical protein [unclassified Sphingobium]OAN59321.1 hypothetical protein A7Q26_00515 [Sphingobium sp. TCM1]WIW90100.1 hypothetical protein K3M67_18745 [Sphingobium sp. V4]
MNHFAKLALLVPVTVAFATPALADDAVQLSSASVSAADYKGKMLYTAAGDRLAAVYRVGQDGAAQIILNGKMVVVPAASLTAADGKLTTNLSKRDLLVAR